MLVIPRSYIIKDGATSAVRQYKNMRNMTGLNLGSAGVLYAGSVVHVCNFEPIHALTSFVFANISLFQGIKSLKNMRLFNPAYKQVRARALKMKNNRSVNIPVMQVKSDNEKSARIIQLQPLKNKAKNIFYGKNNKILNKIQ